MEDLQQENATLREENARLRSEMEDLRRELEWMQVQQEKEKKQWRWAKIGSSLTQVEHWEKLPDAGEDRPWFDNSLRETYNWKWWSTWCPCCRRPVEFYLYRSFDAFRATLRINGKKVLKQENDDLILQSQESYGSNFDLLKKDDSSTGSRYFILLGLPGAQDIQFVEHSVESGPDKRTFLKTTDGKFLTLDPHTRRVTTSSDTLQGAELEVDIQAFERGSPNPPQDRETRFAYAAALWGGEPGFALGALVLGNALRCSGTIHDLVLMHTEDVPQSTRKLLSRVWTKLKCVSFVKANSGLFSMPGTRFDGVFTKLHVFDLVDYDKVLMLDLDLAILQNLDHLFEMDAPAALHRKACGNEHGARINGRTFFVGQHVEADSDVPEWCQCGGINAGVMLLRPEEKLYQQVIKEVQLPYHPERIPGNGPEQDYISRLFAADWRHISVAFNFQLHRVFHALEAAMHKRVEHDEMLPERLRLAADDICVVHFSGEVKIWDHVLKEDHRGKSYQEFADEMLRDGSEYYLRMWLDREGTADEYAQLGVTLEADKSWSCEAFDKTRLNTMINQAVTLAREAAFKATAKWHEHYQKLLDIDELPRLEEELRHQLLNPCWPAAAKYRYKQRVEAFWRQAEKWYPAYITAAHENADADPERAIFYDVMWDEGGFWGGGASMWPSDLRDNL